MHSALAAGFGVARPQGVIVQIGIAGGEMTLPVNMAVAKEIELRGTFRFHEEFALAVDLIGNGRVDVLPLLTETMPLERARDAFELAANRAKAMKVQLASRLGHDLVRQTGSHFSGSMPATSWRRSAMARIRRRRSPVSSDLVRRAGGRRKHLSRKSPRPSARPLTPSRMSPQLMSMSSIMLA